MIAPVPRVPPFDRPATYDDLTSVPDICVAELIGGELHSTPRPRPLHAESGSVLGGRLVPAFREGRGGPGGWRILYEPELHFDGDVLVPDWAGWRSERLPHLPETAYFALAPDWVCEILSPSTAALDRVKKLAIYAREGVPYVWFLDPEARTLEVLRLERSHWTIVATHGGDDVVRAEPFAEIELPLGALWGA